MRQRSHTMQSEHGRRAGFTLVELVVVMGLLGFLLLALIQILVSSMRVWNWGESRTDLTARAALALDLTSRDLKDLEGLRSGASSHGRRAAFRVLQGTPGRPSQSGRLLADWVAINPAGKPAPIEDALEKPRSFDWYPQLRMVIRLDPVEADRLRRAKLRAEIIQEEGQLNPVELEARIAQELVASLLRPVGEVLLRVLPAALGEGAYLALHRNARLLDDAVQMRWVDGGESPAPGLPLLSNLLYVEFKFRSQSSATWSGDADEQGPEICWDSARAGRFPSAHWPLQFSLDLDGASLADPLDDIMPKAVRIFCVVDQGLDLTNPALLSYSIDARNKEIFVEFPERMAEEARFVKIGSEWVQFSGVTGNRLNGVRRGVRATKAVAHRRGARVHIGYSAVLILPIAVAREYHNND